MDNCFSIFKLAFADDQDFAHDLESLGHHYKLYKGLMDQWKEMYPQRILDVRYEDTVSNIQEQCVRLVEFLDLAFEPEMLEFYSTKRLVRTPECKSGTQAYLSVISTSMERNMSNISKLWSKRWVMS